MPCHVERPDVRSCASTCRALYHHWPKMLDRRHFGRPAKPMGSPRVGSNPTGVDCCVICSHPPRVSQFQASVAGTLCQARLVPLDQRLGRPTPPRQMWSGAPQALSCQCSCIPGHSRVQRHDAIFPKAGMGKNMVCHGGGCRG